VPELGLFAVPDLAWNGVEPASVVPRPPDPPPDEFTRCTGPRPRTTLRVPGAEAVYLDARLPDELAQLRARERWLTDLADLFGQFVVLLDVPRGLPPASVATWRAAFDSSYAAAYHPWPGMIPAGGAVARFVPPCAVAAGIIAARERAAGLATGPANQLATGAVTISDLVTDAEHDALHPLGINVFRAERDGFRLTAARTLSLDRDYRQLTVRRLLTMLRITLDRESQWAVFEPNTATLRAVLVLHLSDLLREQFRAGAFAGATEEESYFVRAGDDLNPPESIALGRVVFEVGVAPSEPLEFIVLRIVQEGGAAVIEEVPGGGS
jgi:phage tail sheath protein FI